MKINTLTSKATLARGVASVLSLASLAASLPAEGAWVRPYANGSTADNLLNFNNGSGGTVTAPLPSFNLGLSYSNTPASTTGGGWALASSGSLALGVGISNIATAQAVTSVSSSHGKFELVISGVTQLASVNYPVTWSASSGSISGSDTWGMDTEAYRYNFKLQLNPSVYDSASAFYQSITLRVEAGSEEIHKVEGLDSILEITKDTDIANASVEFQYDPTNGPLKITWSAGTTLNIAFLQALGNGTSSIFDVSDGSVEVNNIPEPSTYLLVGAGVVGLSFLRRRRQS